MLFAGHGGELELRREGGETRLRGRFPYNSPAVLSDGGRGGGRPKKEVIASRAFAFRVEDPSKEIHLLVGHDFDHPLASKLTNTLSMRDTMEALFFEARISPAIAETSYGKDVLAQIATGLAFGVSPGFRLPPPRRVAKPETITEEEVTDGTPDRHGEPQFGAIIRTVHSALLYELSIVTRPAYKDSQIEMRNWQPAETPDAGLHRVLNRWRA